MPHVVFQLVGGPWDGQTLSTDSADEANACFAQALYAISNGRCGARIPLVAPAAKRKSSARINPQAPRSYDYEIDRSELQAGELRIVARHVAAS
jgi:hypothetical protein